MGASWIEIETLLKQLDDVTAFPHSEALLPVSRARDTVAEAAMIVSRAALDGGETHEANARIAMARARVTLDEAQAAVRRAREAVEVSKTGCDRAHKLIQEARELRARDTARPDRRAVPRPETPGRRLASTPPDAARIFTGS